MDSLEDMQYLTDFYDTDFDNSFILDEIFEDKQLHALLEVSRAVSLL